MQDTPDIPTMRVVAYGPDTQSIWDDFVTVSKNGTFLFMRGYMDYHADRFSDHSLLIYSGDRVVALLPAHRESDALVSHGGLTYGGLITDTWMTTPRMIRTFAAVVDHCQREGVRRLSYKTVPNIYHRAPADEDRYALFYAGANVYRRDLLSVIDYRCVVRFQERRRRGIKKAEREGVEVRQTADYGTFWAILRENLSTHYDRTPVHSLPEIELLANRFPDQIRLFGSYRNGAMIAGAVMYLSESVCHVQYNAANEEGRVTGALDILFAHLIDLYQPSRRYFDFGVSTEQEGRYLNNGLVEYKEGFGSRAIVHDFYELQLANS